MSAALDQDATPRRVADELAWELLRDEWELLLAIGSGPTGLADASARLGDPAEALRPRVDALLRHGLVRRLDGGFGLVPAVHERQEGMASYLRDLVLKRIDVAGPPPLSARVRYGLGDPTALARLLADADARLFPAVVEAASGPEGEGARRFLAVFTAGLGGPAPDGVDAGPEGLTGGPALTCELVRMLRVAALERSRPDTAPHAKLWVAEMRVDPDVALRIADTMDAFLTAAPASPGAGAAAFALWPVTTPSAGPSQESPCAR